MHTLQIEKIACIHEAYISSGILQSSLRYRHFGLRILQYGLTLGDDA